jgi:thiol-disulfide isomerase/thioredoxin
MTASYTWEYNLVQHPELDPRIRSPVSQFGNLMVINIEKDKEKDFFALLAKSSILVYFSRSDCIACEKEVPIIKALSQETQIPVWNASLDSAPLKGFDNVMVAPATLKPAALLSVEWVPALFLYLAPLSPGGSEQWIRIGNGLTDLPTLKNRIINFVEAYRHALTQGVSRGRKTQIPNFSALKPYLLAEDSMMTLVNGPDHKTYSEKKT